jgi:hypothetical protein
MADFVPFPRRRLSDQLTRAECQRLADKMQLLVLRHPVAARELEKAIDNLLTELEPDGRF